MPSLIEMVGKTITALVPFFDRTKFQQMKLHGVEAGGIWVESQKMTDVLFSTSGASYAPKTVIFFLPFQQVTFVFGVLDVPSFSETKLGLK